LNANFTHFIFSAIPELNKDAKTKSILETIKALSEDERSIKTLLTNDFLHQYGLLDPTRFVIRGAPSIPNPQVEVASASIQTEQPTTRDESVSDPSLKKCSESPNGVEVPKKTTLSLATITEEGGTPLHISEKTPVEVEKELAGDHPVEEEQPIAVESNIDPVHQAEQGGGDSSTFHGLTDLMDTSKDLIVDDSTTSKFNAPITSIIPSPSVIPIAKEPTLTHKAPDSSQSKSKSGS